MKLQFTCFSVLVKEGDTKGIQGFVKVLEAIRHDGMKINGDDLPRFLDRSFRSVGVGNVIFVAYCGVYT